MASDVQYALPQTFAWNGVRSYLLTESGALHVAIEERAATTTILRLSLCEVDVALPCAQR